MSIEFLCGKAGYKYDDFVHNRCTCLEFSPPYRTVQVSKVELQRVLKIKDWSKGVDVKTIDGKEIKLICEREKIEQIINIGIQ